MAGRCSTCIYRPGNLMHLRPGRLKMLTAENIRRGTALTCHATLPGSHDGVRPAVCRGFFDAVGWRTNILRVFGRLLKIHRDTWSWVQDPSLREGDVSRETVTERTCERDEDCGWRGDVAVLIYNEMVTDHVADVAWTCPRCGHEHVEEL